MFGAWQDPLDAVAKHRGPRRGRWYKRLVVLVLLAATAAGATALYRRGTTRRTAHERAQVAKDVATFLADGELGRLAQFLDVLLPPGQPLLASDPYLDLIVSADAALFRYQDAEPRRLARIEPYLSLASSQPARLLAHLTVASRPERAYDQEALAVLGPSFAKDPEYHTLMATMIEQRGDGKAAAASWERSFQAGPLWLPHRYQQCAFEARQRNPAAVLRVAEHMGKVAPDSAWTSLVRRHFLPTAAATDSRPPGPPSPVAQYYAELASVLPSLAAKDLPSARQALGRALAAVHGQAAFVLDAFVALLDAKAETMALELTSYEAWPRANPWAQTKLAELQAAVAERKEAPAAVASPAESPAPPPVAAPAKVKLKKAAAKKKGGKAKRPGSRRRR